MPDRFTNFSQAIIAAVQAGATIEEAAISVDVPAGTVRRWIGTGRKGREPYADFANAVDVARRDRKSAEDALDGPLTDEEAKLLIARAARKGSVPALRLWYDLQGSDNAGRRGQDARKAIADVFSDGS
jgi:hypothetical protein